ncbi:histidine phosphatase family protein [Pseudomonas sp. dw_358]|uniref:histidine phosphatase family protein n=1 Tax=Pseudomonas sp. dw_358 TaxID=2720083 RepID=UPI001BD6D931|nr:histidine phosphatase family protein [Pseudomonas sp. dw_358]
MTQKTPTLYLVRHGETDYNAQNRLQGRRDIPLNATGRRQAAESGLCLHTFLARPDSLDFIASPLGRACETMEIIRIRLGLAAADYRTDQRLMEIAFGEWEGMTWDDIAQAQPTRYEARATDPVHFIPTGGENYPMVFERLGALLSSLECDTLLVAHAGILRSALALLAGVEREWVPLIEIPQDQVLVLRDGGFTWLRASSALDGRGVDWG